MVPPAPGLLSIMTLCPSRAANALPMSRALWSVGPPGGNGTTIVMTREGNASALYTDAHGAKANARTPAIFLNFFIVDNHYWLDIKKGRTWPWRGPNVALPEAAKKQIIMID